MIKKVILFLVFFSGYASAVDFVYRVDSRPPDEIFRDGFRSHGANRNLQQHIRGIHVQQEAGIVHLLPPLPV